MRWTWYLPALAVTALLAGSMPATALTWSAWDDDDWLDDDFDDIFDDDDSIFDDDDSIFDDDDDDWFDDDWRFGRHRDRDLFDGFGRHRFRFDVDSDLSSLVLANALRGGDGCLDIQTLVLLDAIDDGRLSQRDVRELALVRHLVETGVLKDSCVT